VYLSATELLELEHARLRLRRFGFVLDRGRLVREAIAILLADLDTRGKDSLVARRIRSSQEADQDYGQSAVGNGGQDKDGDAVPSLSTLSFLMFLGSGTARQGQKRKKFCGHNGRQHDERRPYRGRGR
jgi:hypothetical protein